MVCFVWIYFLDFRDLRRDFRDLRRDFDFLDPLLFLLFLFASFSSSSSSDDDDEEDDFDFLELREEDAEEDPSRLHSDLRLLASFIASFKVHELFFALHSVWIRFTNANHFSPMYTKRREIYYY